MVTSVHVGQSGIQLGCAFWELMCLEHNVGYGGQFTESEDASSLLQVHEASKPNSQTNSRSSSPANGGGGGGGGGGGFTTLSMATSTPTACWDRMFAESASGMDKLIPRSILLDDDPVAIHDVKSSGLGKLFRDDSFILAKDTPMCVWSVRPGYREELEDRMRRLAESENMAPEIMVFHSLAGCMGSAGAAETVEIAKRLSIPTYLFSLATSRKPRPMDPVVEPINSVLALAQFIENATMAVLSDNQALREAARRSREALELNVHSVNRFYAQAVSTVTSGFRAANNGATGLTLTQTARSAVYGNNKFMSITHDYFPSCPQVQALPAPTALSSYMPRKRHVNASNAAAEKMEAKAKQLSNTNLSELTNSPSMEEIRPVPQLLDNDGTSLSMSREEQQMTMLPEELEFDNRVDIFSGTAFFRGSWNQREYGAFTSLMLRSPWCTFSPIVPACWRVATSPIFPNVTPIGLSPQRSRCVSLLASHSGIVEYFQDTLNRFDKLWSKRAFAHWYWCDYDNLRYDRESIREYLDSLRDVYRSEVLSDSEEETEPVNQTHTEATHSVGERSETEDRSERHGEGEGDGDGDGDTTFPSNNDDSDDDGAGGGMRIVIDTVEFNPMEASTDEDDSSQDGET